VKKTRQIKKQSLRSDSIGMEKLSTTPTSRPRYAPRRAASAQQDRGDRHHCDLNFCGGRAGLDRVCSLGQMIGALSIVAAHRRQVLPSGSVA
jgi:hypothetical protein